jgi:hypothetical protein
LPGHHDRLLARAAAGDQHVEAVRPFDRAIGGLGKVVAHSLVDGTRGLVESALHPARVGAFLVLVLHQHGNIIFNRCPSRNIVPQRALGQRFADLLGQKVVEADRP